MNGREQQGSTCLEYARSGFGKVAAISWIFFCFADPRTVLPQSPATDDFHPGVTEFVVALAVQPDGKILVGGIRDTSSSSERRALSRLNPDGTIDEGFDSPLAGGSIYTIALEEDGCLLVGGRLYLNGSASARPLARLAPDGTVLDEFNAADGNLIHSIVVQSDRRIVVGGMISSLGGLPRGNLGRLYADGTVDQTFDPQADKPVHCLAIQAGGRILAAGSFTKIGGQSRNRLARLEADGTLEPTFNPNPNDYVNCLAVLPRGGFVAGGSFTTLGGGTRLRRRIARFAEDGTLDSNFRPEVGDPESTRDGVYSLAPMADGSLLIGGFFAYVNDALSVGIARILPDGETDVAFNAEPFSRVFALAAQHDGKMLVGGDLYNVNGGKRSNNLARLQSYGQAGQSLVISNSSLTWIRGGPAPQVWRTVFEHSMDGLAWERLGSGTPTTRGWFLDDAGIPLHSYVRARGAVSGGAYNSSGSFTESYAAKPIILSQPTSRASSLGTTNAWHVRVGGSEPLTYQWFKNGTVLPDFSTPTLELSGVSYDDAGQYHLVVSNAYGQVVSDTFELVMDRMSLDPDFDPSLNEAINAIAVEPDGGVLLGGAFTSAGGLAKTNLVRLRANGDLNPSLHDWAVAEEISFVNALAVEVSGNILVGGRFRTVGSESRTNLARINPAGEVDLTFHPYVHNDVLGLTIQTDRGILPILSIMGGGLRYPLSRFLENGTLDTSFSGSFELLSYSYPPLIVGNAVLQQDDGNLLLGGSFQKLSLVSRANLGRLFSDGTTDPGFDPGADAPVLAMVLQSDGNILVGGVFSRLAGAVRRYLGRLHSDGSLDESFAPAVDGAVHTLALQTDGKILLGGQFATVNGQPRDRLARLHPEGTLDSTFHPWADDAVTILAIRPDGRVLVGGRFTTLNGESRNYVGLLHTDEPATQHLERQDASVRWWRGGTSPEIWHATLEYRDNDGLWSDPTAGSRFPGGWQFDIVGAPPGAVWRARGFVAGGDNADWFAKTIWSERPRLENPAWLDGTNFSFSLLGQPNQIYRIDASTNLMSWYKMGHLTNLPTATPVTLPLESKLSPMFFRAVRCRGAGSDHE